MESWLRAALANALEPGSWAELAGAITGVLCVWLLARQHVLSWPLGIANNALFLLLFWSSRLYADALLQVVFAALNGYGWWLWTRPVQARSGARLRVRETTRCEWAAQLGLALLGSALTGWFLARNTESPAPWWDASVFTLSLVATYGQAQKQLESWYVWIAVNLLSIPLYVWRGLHTTALLYALFLVLCWQGLRSWRRELAARGAGS